MDLQSLTDKGWISRPRQSQSAGATFPFGLAEVGLHEVAEASYGDMPAATGFALAALRARARPIVWVSEQQRTATHGAVPSAALNAFAKGALRLDVEARRTADALWAVEEAVASGVAGLVIADLSAVDFTATRRLALAASRHQVPVILLLPWQTEGASAAAARWRISSMPSAPNRFDSRAPGATRWRARLERCRPAPARAGETFEIEWSDETLSLTVVPALAAGAPRPDDSARLRA